MMGICVTVIEPPLSESRKEDLSLNKVKFHEGQHQL